MSDSPAQEASKRLPETPRQDQAPNPLEEERRPSAGPAALLLHLAGAFRLAESETELCGQITTALVQKLGYQRAILLLKEGTYLRPCSLNWPAGDAAALLAALQAQPPSLQADATVHESFALGQALPMVVGQSRFFAARAQALLGPESEVVLAPLFSNREFLGALAADPAGAYGPGLGEEYLNLLEAVATLAGAMLGSMRLYAALEEKNRELSVHLRELTVVSELTRILNRSKEPAEMARLMLQLLAQTLEADFGFLFLYHCKAKELRLLGSHGLPPHLQEAWASLWSVDHQLLDSALGETSPALRGLLPGLEGPALLRVLGSRQRAVGLWGLGRWDRQNPFQSGEERVLAAADEQMSVALNSMRLRLVAATDYLTALYTRAHFVEALDQEMRLASYLGHPLGLLLMDADHFKQVNDNYGHQAGDQVLSALGGVLKACTRSGDTCARIGGEEFAVILPRSDLEGVCRAAEKIRAQVAEQAASYRGQCLRITVSLGVAILEPGQPLGRDEFLRRADQALYRAKRGGRNQVASYQAGQDEETWGSLD